MLKNDKCLVYIKYKYIFVYIDNNNDDTMSEFISTIVNNTISNFDFSFCVVVNILTYIIITLIIEVRNKKNITTWSKRGVFVVVCVLSGVVYYFTGTEGKILFNSFILAPVSWSWLFKPICKKLNIDYSNIKND